MGFLDDWGGMLGQQQPQQPGAVPGSGGILGGLGGHLNNAMNDPLFMMGLSMIGTRKGQEQAAMQNAMQMMMMQKAFATQRDDKKKAEAIDARNFAHTQAESRRVQGNADRTSNLAERQAREPKYMPGPDGSIIKIPDQDTPGVSVPGAIAPSPAGAQAQPGMGAAPAPGALPGGLQVVFPGKRPEMSAGDKKAINDAEDEGLPLRATKEALQRARTLTDKVYTGAGAGAREWAGTALWDGAVPDVFAKPDIAKNTKEFNQIMNEQAIKKMAESMKGSTTDKEMFKNLDIINDPNSPPELRRSTIDRMLNLVKMQEALNARRISGLKGGTYYKPGEAPGAPPADSATPPGKGGTTAGGLKWSMD